MKSYFLAAAALSLAFGSIPAAAAPGAAEITAAGEAERRGAEMFAYDQAAWHATDRFQEDLRKQGRGMEQAIGAGLEGYIVEPGEGSDLIATFFGNRGGTRFAMARYIVRGRVVVGGGFVESDGPKDLSLIALRMIDAREKALAEMQRSKLGFCTKSAPNSLVLPPQPNGVLPVYILSSATAADSYPAGGHYRFDFDADGKLVGQREFTKACVNVPYPPAGQNPKDLLFTMSHFLDRQPTEIHAFVSRNIPMPMAVVTAENHHFWSVDEGSISYVSDIPHNPPPR